MYDLSQEFENQCNNSIAELEQRLRRAAANTELMTNQAYGLLSSQLQQVERTYHGYCDQFDQALIQQGFGVHSFNKQAGAELAKLNRQADQLQRDYSDAVKLMPTHDPDTWRRINAKFDDVKSRPALANTHLEQTNHALHQQWTQLRGEQTDRFRSIHQYIADARSGHHPELQLRSASDRLMTVRDDLHLFCGKVAKANIELEARSHETRVIELIQARGAQLTALKSEMEALRQDARAYLPRLTVQGHTYTFRPTVVLAEQVQRLGDLMRIAPADQVAAQLQAVRATLYQLGDQVQKYGEATTKLDKPVQFGLHSLPHESLAVLGLGAKTVDEHLIAGQPKEAQAQLAEMSHHLQRLEANINQEKRAADLIEGKDVGRDR